MEIKTVTYGRLFSLGNYHNERIEFTATLSPEDDAGKALGTLFKKVTDAEKLLSFYRQVLSHVESVLGEIAHVQLNIASQETQIAQTKISIQELTEKISKGEDDVRLRHACNSTSLKDLEQQLQDWKDRLREALKRQTAIDGYLKKVEERIENGQFSTEGLEQPEHSHGLFEE